MRDLILRRLDKLALLGVVLSLGAAPAFAAEGGAGGHYVIDAKAMKPARFGPATAYAIRPDGGLRNLTTVYTCFNAGVHLPHNMGITRVTVAYASGASPNNPVAAIIRTPLVTAAAEAEVVALRALSDNSGVRKLAALPLTGPTLVENNRYSYALSVCLDGAEKDAFYAVRITYTKLVSL
jgi:hypothetical protein